MPKLIKARHFKYLLHGICLVVVASLLSSCASAPKKTIKPPSSYLPDPVIRRDAYHDVAPGETFWRISQMYDVPIASIMKANRLSNPNQLEMGQKLLIPNASKVKPVITLYPNNKWKYIVIHHSATEVGNSLSFHNAHLKRGWDRGVGYHFIIDNDSGGKEDGQIEVGPRWLKQQDGAHCKASDMNEKGIGICLVGNFNSDRVTANQMESLVHLVNKLKEYYHISNRNIIQHGHVPEAVTECPGTHFPWEEFKRRLN